MQHSSKSFNWLHLSDLHLSKTRTWESDLVVSRLFEECEKIQRVEGFYPDAIFFTGDAVFGTQPDDPIENQFEAFSTFLDKLRNSFSPAIEKKIIFL
jgi:predicted MPP superfamily phosphohydrolase